ncbi:BTAD domain-containing putative transcriptional regulator [Nocardia sp. NPDC004151]|uniref:BTAD domain-containing putative transcriptional regulator n=1 Tax=Nocardia sp. NPDC004151 TaxID=3364304 RepID=UPI0036BFDF8F
MVFVEVLGALRVTVDGRPAPLRGPRQGAVLARLVSAGGEVVSADRLIEDLWQGEPPPKASGALQAHISYLRRALEPDRPPRAPAGVLVSQTPGYALRLPVSAVDVWHFDHLVSTAATESDPAARHRLLDSALALWRGPAYAAYADAAWSAADIARLTDMRWTAVEQRADAALALGRPEEAVAALRRLVDEHPEREAAVRLLALAHYRQGRQLEALATLRDLRATLNTEFGIDPSPPVRELEAAILAHDPALAPPAPAEPFAAESGSARSHSTDDVAATIASVVPDRPEPVSPVSAPVGYAGQRGALLSAAREAAGGRGRLVWLEGEAGAGKTTLVRSVADELAAAGWRTAVGRCPEVDGAPAAWAWMELTGESGSKAADLGADATPFHLSLAVVDRFAEWTGHPIDTPGGRMSPGSVVPDTPSSVDTASVAGPVLVVLEDAHRADGATLQILRQVVAWSAQAPVLFVVTMRGSEVGDEVRATSAALAAVTSGRLELTGLDLEAVRTVAGAAGLRGIDNATAELVRDRTGGNPLFVAELAKLAAAEGDLLAVPAGVSDVLHRRIARLPAEAARMLRLLAVWGGESDFDALLELTGETEGALVDLVDTVVVAGLLRLESGGRIRFGHALTRDAVYAGIPALRRGRMHWSALRVAEQVNPVDPALLAHHALTGAHAGTAGEALGYVLAAARQDGARRAFAEAEPLWRAALDLHTLAGHREDGPDPVVGAAILEVRCALVNALAYRGNDAAARAERAAALDLAEHLAAITRTGPASTDHGSAASAGHESSALLASGPHLSAARGSAAAASGEMADRSSGAAMDPVVPGSGRARGESSAGWGLADESAGPAVDPVAMALGSWRAPLIWGTRDKRLPDERVIGALRAALARPLPDGVRVRLLVALVVEVEGDDDPLAFAASAEAVATARDLGDPELLCAALNVRAYVALGPDLWDERAGLADELLAVSTAAGLVEYQAVAHFLGCLIAGADNDLVRARRAAERGLECATGGQLHQMLIVLTLFDAVLMVSRGDLDAAERAYADASARLVAAGAANGAELLIAGAMMLGWARGDLSALVEPMAQVHAVSPDALALAYALALLDSGDIDTARAVFAAAAPIRRDHYWSVMAVFRARVALRLGDLAAAADCYRDMLPRSGTVAGLDTGSVVYGPIDTVLAELADALGDPEAAAAHRTRATEVAAHLTAQLATLPPTGAK